MFFFRKIYDFRKSGAHQTVSTELIVYNRKANHKSAEHFLKESKTPKQNNEKKKNRIHKSNTRNAGAGCVGVFHSTSFFKKNATVFFLSLVCFFRCHLNDNFAVRAAAELNTSKSHILIECKRSARRKQKKSFFCQSEETRGEVEEYIQNLCIYNLLLIRRVLRPFSLLHSLISG